MKRKDILDSLKNSEEPLKIQELSELIDVPVDRLRVNLYRLQEEGIVQSVQKGGKLRWKKKGKTPEEEKYESMSENPT